MFAASQPITRPLEYTFSGGYAKTPNITIIEHRTLANPHPGLEQQLDNRIITRWISGVLGCTEQRIYLAISQASGFARCLPSHKFQVGGWIDGHTPLVI